ncbi:MAG: NTP transferase domain-containing protein [Pseudomonadota bacterium]
MAARLRQVVLLAAGMGTRLGTLNGGRPKALLSVAGRTLLERALDYAEALDAEERIVVGGFGFALLSEQLERASRPAVRLLENPEYRLGNLRTLETALPWITGSFLLMNIDHIYPRPVALRVSQAFAGNRIAACCDYDRALGPDDMKIELGEVGEVGEARSGGGEQDKRVVRIAKTLAEYQCGYVGMTFVPEEKLARYQIAVAATARQHGDPATVEQVLQRLADDGEQVTTCDISGIGWYEVDDPADYARAVAGLGSFAS